MKERVLKNLKKMRNPEKVKNHYDTYLEEAISYIENTDDATKKLVDANWLLKRALDDMFEGEVDSITFNKISRYLHEYDKKNL